MTSPQFWTKSWLNNKGEGGMFCGGPINGGGRWCQSILLSETTILYLVLHYIVDTIFKPLMYQA